MAERGEDVDLAVDRHIDRIEAKLTVADDRIERYSRLLAEAEAGRDAAFAEVERLHGIVVHDTIEMRRLAVIVDLCCAEHEAWKTQNDTPAGPVWTAKGAFSAWIEATHARVAAVAAEVERRRG